MIYDPQRLLLIAGPCSLESEAICMAVAEVLAEMQKKHPQLNIVFKGSFDKANRTSMAGERGPGIHHGLKILKHIRDQFKFPVTTDIHSADQAEQIAQVCDVLQIPAFLCRQTDLLAAAAATGKAVNVKKGQFLAPQDMAHVMAKFKNSAASEVWQTERGTTFGYHNLIVDMRSFAIMKQNGHPTIFDATHSVQLPSAADGKSGGQREFVATLACAAMAAGANGLFIETHPNPEKAISDAASQVPLKEFPKLIEQCLKHWEFANDKS